ncbi:hypothetical protein [Paenibacillus montanisoli]|uniref:Uncharacterized protein n=1 Tax=Paenibacillus montanisoli TaxID=2081970 RepID=A0A328U4U5_9BACL|nr:hypothetical protein [Paenibacillus montanisoli]RAP77102.1 hypothetical protein DL346_00935 [Paenibacillus montanisoli]
MMQVVPNAAIPARAVRVSTGKDYWTILFGMWLIGGVFVDGFAHNHGVVETFFTPWHAILYSGFMASAIWMVWLLYVSKRTTGAPWTKAAPVGYGLGLIGVLIFLLGGLGDMYWHVVFGIEQSIAALLSPSHLMLLLGALLILSSPFRASWHNENMTKPGWLEFAPAFLSLVLTVGAVSFFLMYAWMFRYNLPAASSVDWYVSQFGYGMVVENNETRGLAFILLNTLVLMYPVFLLMKRWQLPYGSLALLFAIVMVMMNVLDGFEFYQSIILGGAVGLLGDLLYKWLKAGEGRMWAQRIIAAVLPIALWGGYFGYMQAVDGIGWSAELWSGAIVEAALLSVGLQLLAAPRAKG